MQGKLCCPCCSYRLENPGVLDQMTGQEGWYALGDGETFEDLLYANFAAEGPVPCPECGAPIPVTEQDLNSLALELLARC